jgi:hypothetical protein
MRRAPRFDLDRVDPAPPTALDLAGAISGHLALGAAFAVARMIRAGGEVPLAAVLGPLGAQVGGLFFAAPTLLVVHAWLGMRARPEALTGALAWATVRHGRVAMALAPVALVFAFAGRTSTGVNLLTFYALGMLGCWTLARTVVAVERQADPDLSVATHLLALAWSLLAGAVGVSLFFVGLGLLR